MNIEIDESELIKKISSLLIIAEYINRKDLISYLNEIRDKCSSIDADLMLPLVGDFSSGKTTLVNSLTDCKKLEAAITPTTATIYEIHFGCDRCSASALFDDEYKEIDMDELKNDVLLDAKVVKLKDTSTKVSSSIVLVDTPGLSAPNPAHKQTLIEYLPQADGLLLIVDINSTLNRSLLEFIDTVKLTNLPSYIILTKCDTKSSDDAQRVEKNIRQNCSIKIDDVVCVSAIKDDLGPLYELLNKLQKNKTAIIKQVSEQRTKNVATLMIEQIDDLLKASLSEEELESAILQQSNKLKKINQNIHHLMNILTEEIETQEKKTIRIFEDTIGSRLNSLVVARCNNMDVETTSIINNTTSVLFNEFKDQIIKIFTTNCSQNMTQPDAMGSQSLSILDITPYSMSEMNCDLNLNSVGHQFDGIISKAVNVASTLHPVAAVAISMLPVDEFISLITDEIGKPQRVRAIHNFVDNNVLPTFKQDVNRAGQDIIRSIETTLCNEAASAIDQTTEALQQLKSELNQKNEIFSQRVAQLRNYRTDLSKI